MNEFENIDKTEFDTIANTQDLNEIMPDDIGSGSYIKTPDVGQSVEFIVKKIVSNPKTSFTKDGSTIEIGCKTSDGTIIRRDIITDKDEIYTVNSWGIFYKLFGSNSEFLKLAKSRKTFAGIKVKINRNYNGQYAKSFKPEMIAKLEGISIEDAIKLRQTVEKAIKEGTIYTVEVSV